MNERSLYLSNAARLTPSHRPSQLARTDLESRTNSAKGNLSRVNPSQFFWQHLETPDLDPRTVASVNVKDAPNRALSP